MMIAQRSELIAHLFRRLAEVRQLLGYEEPLAEDSEMPFADLIDSMGLVEFVAWIADDCGIDIEVIERCTDGRFHNIGLLADALLDADLMPRSRTSLAPVTIAAPSRIGCWLSAVTVRLPQTIQPSTVLDEMISRPRGWMEQHAGIR